MSDRIHRVNSVIARALASIFLQFNNALKYLTITEVQTSKDLSICKVFYRIMPQANTSKEQLTKIIKTNQKNIRYQLAKNIQLRKTPELTFVFDALIDKINHMEDLLKKVPK